MLFPYKDDVPALKPPIVTSALIGLNALMFLALVLKTPYQRQLTILHHGFMPARLKQLRDPVPLEIDIDRLAEHPHLHVPVLFREVLPLAPNRGEILRTLITSLFLHGSWLHLLGNMWFLWLFGDNVEGRLGHIGYLLYYLAGGVISSMCHAWYDPLSRVPVIGASGAVACILGAYAITWPWARVRTLVVLVIFFTVVDLPALGVLGFWIVGQLLEARRELALGINGGVALWAHIGGFVFGLLTMPILRGKPPSNELTRDASRVTDQIPRDP